MGIHGSWGKDIATLLDYADTKKAIAQKNEDDRSSLEELMGGRGSPIVIMSDQDKGRYGQGKKVGL